MILIKPFLKLLIVISCLVYLVTFFLTEEAVFSQPISRTIKVIKIELIQEGSCNWVPLRLRLDESYRVIATDIFEKTGIKVAKDDSMDFDATLEIVERYCELKPGDKITGTINLKLRSGSLIRDCPFQDSIIQSMPMNPALFKEGKRGAAIWVDTTDFKKRLSSLVESHK